MELVIRANNLESVNGWINVVTHIPIVSREDVYTRFDLIPLPRQGVIPCRNWFDILKMKLL